jgi:TATA-box binding protein (TBP) (component of TFIID and TFIIIB)
MTNETLTVDELRSSVTDTEVELTDGTVAGYSRFEQDFALGSIEIAYGEDEAIYDESVFPGVIYPANELSSTVVVSGDGTVAILDARDDVHARDALSSAIEMLEELYLIDDEPIETVIPADKIPFTLDPPEVATLGSNTDAEESN